ncbi:MAG: serine hydrolase [Armatimonadetes bacterium]|nr:serine hydrolase [Armatimonadota bacterium]
MHRRRNAALLFVLASLVLVAPAYASGDSEPVRQSTPGLDWERSEPAAEGIDPLVLQVAIERLDQQLAEVGGTRELMVVRHGRVIHQGPSVDRKHNVWSITKSVSSSLLGLLIADNRLSLDRKAADLAHGLELLYPRMTVRQLATMTSGYDGEGGTYGVDDPLDGSLTPLSPTTPLFEPGARFAYSDDAQRMLGFVLTLAAGEPLADLFRRRIAEPIGLRDWTWDTVHCDMSGVVVNDAASHLYLDARDVARLGLLWLRAGRWGERQVLPAEWVAQATGNQVPLQLPPNQTSRRQAYLDGRGVYGFGWWVNGGDGTWCAWPGAPARTYCGAGLNQNKLFVVPEWDMLVVRLGVAGDLDQDREVWNSFFATLDQGVLSR